jgi:peptidoglycan/xylan/chitin deacetylase (PgdA/CDA1 family)
MNTQSTNSCANLIYSGNSSIKQIALTCDCDGLNYDHTHEILDVLKKHQIKATFFLSGLWVKKYPETARRIASEGHEIGNHSYEHPDLRQRSYTEIKRSIKRAEETIKEITGINPRPLFRAPYGYQDNKVLKAVNDVGYNYSFLWSIDTCDYMQPPSKDIVQTIFENVRRGHIILMHGHGKNTAVAIDFAIETLKTFDFKFITVSELLK